jgi:hypothetical protein
MEKRRLRVTDGGYAVPLGNNYFLMKGKTHEQGGIGLSDKIEVENNEIVKVNKDSAKVYSAQPMIAGYSPAELILRGASPRKVFSIQQSLNGNNNDGYGREGTDFNILKNIGKLVKKIFNKSNDASGIDVNSIVVDPEELKIKQAYAESGFRSDVKSGAGASGLFQIVPDVLKDYNTANNTSFTVDDLSNDSINTVVRDFKFNKTLNSEWVNKNNPSDAVRYAKALVGYNFGNTNTLRRLERAKKDGVDIYNTLDWLSTKYLPEESVNYTKYLLGIGSDGMHRNDAAYAASKKLNKDKVEKIKQYKYDIGGEINFNEDNVKNWITNWLNSRKNQLKENAKSTSFAYRNYKSLNNKGDIRDNSYDVTYENNLLNPLYFLLGKNPNDIRTENIIKSQLYNIDNVATVNVGDYYKPNYGKLGVYVNPNPWNNTGHYIAYKGIPLDGIRVHELTHASHPDQQIDYITNIIYKDRDIPVNKSGRQTKRDKAKEVYSAIQQYRFENGLKPEDVIDKIYIENNKDKIKSTPYLENINEDDLINIFNNVAKNDKNKNNDVFYAKNGGQINMKLKNKNKQDITDMVMNEILYHSTGERKKFLTGGQTLGINAGLQAFNALAQGIAGSVNASNIEKMYNKMTRKSTYVPIARRHINTSYDVSPMLDANRDAEFTLAKNAMANTSSSKVAREQLKQARLARLSGDNTAYSTKINEENKLKAAETELQKQYDIYDNQSLTKDISDKNDFEMQKQLGISNAKTSAANTWGQSVGNLLGSIGNTLLNYTTSNNFLAASNNKDANAQAFINQYGRYYKTNDNGELVVRGLYKNNSKAKNLLEQAKMWYNQLGFGVK